MLPKEFDFTFSKVFFFLPWQKNTEIYVIAFTDCKFVTLMKLAGGTEGSANISFDVLLSRQNKSRDKRLLNTFKTKWLHKPLGMHNIKSFNIAHLFFFLGAFGKLRTATISFVISVRPHWKTRLPLDGFRINLIFGLFLFETKLKVHQNQTRITVTLH